ncbi:MAG: alkaline phosphatase family protein [Balneolaceae bacterium]|nr:MAG: alkaline phosphatase family protein [Balneolaceae bacterium]
MKKIVAICILITISVSQIYGNSSENRTDRNVIILSIDGFPADLLWNETIDIPTLRKLAENGAYAHSLIPTNPTLTWPNHTTMVTGVNSMSHCVLFNGKVEYTIGSLPVNLNSNKDKNELVAVPTLYDVAFEAGLYTADINWPATRNAGTLHDSFPDVPNSVGHMTDDLLWELFEEGILDDMTNFALWQHDSEGRDEIWLQSALYLIKNRMPNLMMIHLLNLDSSVHRLGLSTEVSKRALKLADSQLERIIQALDTIGERENTTFFIVSDHGFINTPKTILPNVALAQNKLLEIEEGNIVTAKAQAVGTGGFAFVYLKDPDDEEIFSEVIRIFQDVEGINSVITADEFDKYGLPHPVDCQQSGWFLLAAEAGYSFNNSIRENEIVVSSEEYGFSLAHHGFLNSYSQMSGTFVAYGNGIAKGTVIERVDMRSIAPTVAHILGLDLDTADGEVLLDIFDVEVVN